MLKKTCNLLFRLPSQGSPLSGRFNRIIPAPILMTLRSFRQRLLPVTEKIRINKTLTKFLGPEYPPTHKKIEIDITYNCGLKCLHCNRLLDFAPSGVHMSIGQIKKFVEESIKLQRRWETIFLSGGEPLRHPDIFEIVNIVLDYKKRYSPYTKILLLTNGVDKKNLSLFPAVIGIIDSQKNICPQKHYPITIAPMDLNEYGHADFCNGCVIPRICAMGLNMHGYYQCTVAAAIDRIFGFDVGRKTLPFLDDNMIDLYRMFCRYCGHFLRSGNTCGKTISPTWEKAIDKYQKSKPSLSLY